MNLIKTIDGKLHHLAELDFIERELFGVFNPQRFYKDLFNYLYATDEVDLISKKYINLEEVHKIDDYVSGYFYNKIPDAKVWILRAYIIGRLLGETDTQAQIFRIDSVYKLPSIIEDAVKQFNLSIEEALAMRNAIERGGQLITNTTTSTLQQVKIALTEAIERGEGAKGVERRLRDMVDEEIGEINRDWERVAISETNTAFANGYIETLDKGEYVVGISMPDACPHCMRDINGKVYKVRSEAPPDYQDLEEGETKENLKKIWETQIWAGKNNFGRSSSKRKRIDKELGNREDNLVRREHHELSMPVIPYHPHCFKGDVEIYTKKGWRRFDELEKGIEVATINMKTKEMVYQMPYEYINYEYSGKMIKLFSKNVNIEMTEEHNVLCGVRNKASDRKHKELRLIKANDLKNRDITIPISVENYKSEEKTITIGKHKLSEKLYANLMGYYLSEGNGKAKKHSWEVKITQYKPASNLKIYEDLKDLDVNLRHYDHSIQFNDKDLCSYLSKFGKSWTKYIPDEVKNLSKEGLRTFLDAYVLGDGSIKTNNTLPGQKNPSISRTISTSSKQLADDLTEVILKAGFGVSYRLDKTKGKEVNFRNGTYTINHDTHIINIKTSKYVQKFDIEENQYKGQVYCVSVPNETILVRSNGKVLWIGNCRCRWSRIDPEFQWIDENGKIRLSVEDREKHKQWYDREILGYE